MVRVLLLEESYLLADILKSGQNFDQLNPVGSRHRLGHVRGHNSLHQSRALRHCPRGGPFPENILGDQHAGHVARKGNILSALRVFTVNPQPVRVGIGGEDDISVHLLCQFQSQLKGLRRLGVRVGHRREIAVGLLLLRYHINLLKSKLPQNPAHRKIAGTVQRRVDDGKILCHLPDNLRVDRLFLQLLHVGIVNLLTDLPKQPRRLRLPGRHGLYHVKGRDLRHLGENVLIVRRRDLGAILPVYLVAIVLPGIVAGCDHDAGDTSQRAHREGEFRRGPQAGKTIGPDAVGIEAERRLHSKLRGHDPGIIGDDHALLLALLSDNVIGQPLGSLAYRVNIHPIGSRSDNAPEPSGSKLQISVKPILNLILIRRDSRKLRLCVRVKIGIRTPFLICLSVIHTAPPSPTDIPLCLPPSTDPQSVSHPGHGTCRTPERHPPSPR